MKTPFQARYLTLAILFFSLTATSFAQTLSGKVIDRDTDETVAFANVQIGDTYGVITNDEGQFEIAVDRFKPSDSLVFSFLGYARKAIAIKDFNQKIYLSPTALSLDEIYLIDKNLDPFEIMEKVKENISKNYASETEKLSVFQRAKTNAKTQDAHFSIEKADFVDKKLIKMVNSELATLIEKSKGKSSNTYNDTYLEIYKSKKDSLKVDVKKGTKLINLERNTSTDNLQNKAFAAIADKLESSNSFKMRSGIIPISDSIDLRKTFSTATKNDTLEIKSKNRELSQIFKNFGFGKDSDLDFVTDYKKYNFTITKAFPYNEELVYVLRFTPNKGGAKYSGELYVSTETYAVLKANYKFAEGKRGKKINLKFLLGFKYEELEREVLAIFNKNKENVYSLKYLKTNTKQYFYINRSFTFIENNVSKKDRMKLKLDILSEGTNNNENELLVIDTHSISEGEFLGLHQKKKISIQTIEKYDPSIWEPYTIISPNQAIKDFEN